MHKDVSNYRDEISDYYNPRDIDETIFCVFLAHRLLDDGAKEGGMIFQHRHFVKCYQT